jgi:hypothetical protein
MTIKLRATIPLLIFALANCAFAQQLPLVQKDIYTVNQVTKSLTVKWSGGSKTIEGVVGSQGETIRALVTFNGVKALRFENLASRSAFEAYFTLIRHSDNVFVDCIYANVRNEKNGVLINKAVCGLDKPLTEEYEDLVYEFTDEWKSSTAVVVIGSVLKIPPAPINVEEADFGVVKLSRIYKSQDDFSYSVPETSISNVAAKYSFGVGLAFLVYRVDNLNVPAYLDVSSGDYSAKFVRYDSDSLNKLLEEKMQ